MGVVGLRYSYCFQHLFLPPIYDLPKLYALSAKNCSFMPCTTSKTRASTGPACLARSLHARGCVIPRGARRRRGRGARLAELPPHLHDRLWTKQKTRPTVLPPGIWDHGVRSNPNFLRYTTFHHSCYIFYHKTHCACVCNMMIVHVQDMCEKCVKICGICKR